MHILFEIVVLTALGFASGFVGSQVGAGGVIVLPGLLWLGLSIPESIASMSIAGLAINGIAALEYAKAQYLTLQLALPYALVAAAGSIVGTVLLFKVNVDVLSTIFAAVIAFLILVLVFKKKSSKSASRKASWPEFVLGLALSFVIGVYGGLIAIAVTTLAILFFQIILRQNYRTAVANAVFIVTVLQVSHIFVLANGSHINYPYALLLLPGTVVGTILGAKTTIKNGEGYFKALLVLVGLIVVIKLVIA